LQNLHLFIHNISFSLFFIGCSQQNEKHNFAPVSTPMESLDKAKATAIELNFKTDPELVNMKINVEVKFGIATLSGSVPSEEIKAKAENLARKVEGIREVRNNLILE